MKIVIEAFGSDHFYVASLLAKYGSTLKMMGDVSGSIEKFRRSAEILSVIFGEKHPLLIKCYISLGNAAFQLKRTDESHVYFQRAMENVEVVYQVSFPDQLYPKYVKITTNSKYIPCGILTESKRCLTQEHKIEGLVAEYGQGLAVLSSRLNMRHAFQITTKKEKQRPRGKTAKVPKAETVFMISHKSVRDLLRTGQTLLLLGMTNEATSFFQLASKYCQATDVPQGVPGASLVHFYTELSQTSLTDENKWKIEHVLKSLLEEVAADSGIESGDERSLEGTEGLTCDCPLNLKLVLKLLILLSIQLKIYDVTFAANDLYASLSHDDENMLLLFEDRLQVYASRTSITCNGKTAVQDFIASSAIGLIKDDSMHHLDTRPLFRSLAYKNNVPTTSFLATYSTSAFLDVDDVKRLEQKALRSFQEFFEINSIENGGGKIQIAVDLAPPSFSEQNIMLTDDRIELLPLCLSEEVDKDEVHDKARNIAVISPGMCEKITCTTFADERTSCFMFSKICLLLLQHSNPGRVSTLRLQEQCLVLTIIDTVKARITLWLEHKSIKQKVQLVRSAEGHCLSQHNCADLVENQSYCSRVLDKFSPKVILNWAKTRGVTCDASSVVQHCSYSLETVASEPREILLDGPQTGIENSQIIIDETVSK